MSQHAIDLDANAYATYATLQLANGKEMLAELALRGDEQVLDIGCGPGILTALIAQRIPHGHVTGIDASPAMITYAKNQAPPNATFQVMDAARITLPENHFDLVFSNACFHWIEDQQGLLTGIRRVLKAHGLLRAQFLGHEASIIRETAKALCQSEPYSSYLKDFTWPKVNFRKEDYLALVRQVGGFEEVEVWETETQRAFNGEAHLEGWLSSMHRAIYTEPLPEPLREPFFQELVRRVLAAATKSADGTLTLGRGCRLHVRAKKA